MASADNKEPGGLTVLRLPIPDFNAECWNEDCGSPKQCRQETWLALQRFHRKAPVEVHFPSDPLPQRC